MGEKSGALAHLTRLYDDSDAESDIGDSPNNENRNTDFGELTNVGESMDLSGTDDGKDESQEHQDKRQKEVFSFRPVSPTTFHLSLQSLSSPEEIQIPPPAPGQPPLELVKKISTLHEKMKLGIDMKASIEKRKDFRNPSIYEKLIVFCDIDELGTNYPKDIYTPHRWGPEAYYDELARKQKEEMDRKEKERKERTKIEFVTGTAKRSHDETKAGKKSKWDVCSTALSTSSSAPTATASLPSTNVNTSSSVKATLTSKVGALIPGLGVGSSLVGNSINSSVPVISSTISAVKPPVVTIKGTK